MILKIEISADGNHQVTSDTQIDPKNLIMILNNLATQMILNQIELKLDRDVLTPKEVNGSGSVIIHSV